MDDKSRVSREAQARFREGLGVKLPGATRPPTDRQALYSGDGRLGARKSAYLPRLENTGASGPPAYISLEERRELVGSR
jgi:hypothetical protein